MDHERDDLHAALHRSGMTDELAAAVSLAIGNLIAAAVGEHVANEHVKKPKAEKPKKPQARRRWRKR